MMARKFGFTLEVDIHGMRAREAKEQLTILLNQADKSIHEIRVVHGYHQGKALQQMVRTELKHPRIKRKLLSLNNGETILELTQWAP